MSSSTSFRAASHGSSHLPSHTNGLSKRKSPNMIEDGPSGSGPSNNRLDTSDTEEDPRVTTFRNAYDTTETVLASLLRGEITPFEDVHDQFEDNSNHEDEALVQSPVIAKKPARAIDEDDYGDEDDEEDDDKTPAQSPILQKAALAHSNTGNASPRPNLASTIIKPALLKRASQISDSIKAPDDARKKLQQDQQAAEEAARFRFHNMFYTFEYDRAAMLEQQRVDELDRQVEAEMSADKGAAPIHTAVNGVLQGSLSSANLGASSLMLKNLLARIDAKRNLVNAQDWQLRKLISEVRKNRSKWASEEKMGQEELYEAAEKVLSDLKAMTEHSGPFLNRVNKREAPDYYNIIKHPMDIGTMMKKLKGFQYKSKKEFVDDLNLIWANCLAYNTDPNHPLRKKALHLQKHSEQMLFLIPDIVVRDRAEFEAEERRMQHLDAELDGMEDSDDEPIMASRGRKAPSKTAKKGTSSSRKAPPTINEGTPGPEPKDMKPNLLNSQGLRNNTFLRADSDAPMEGVINGFSTPPPPGGNLTPLALNGIIASGASQTDASDADGPGFSNNDLTQADEPDYADIEFRTWKQVTKQARAMAAAERNRMFFNGRINPEEPAILRSKASMRRFVRLQKKYLGSEGFKEASNSSNSKDENPPAMVGETLAEGVEAAEDDNILPDYYDPVSAIPDIATRLQWEEDEDGQVISHVEDCLRVVPAGHFTTPESAFGKRMAANLKQMQETRKLCSKIGVVKQMQLQTQVYQNQFQKYEPAPFYEEDIDAYVISDDGPVISPEVCRAAFQRSIVEILYNAGYEESQPMALDALTDVMGDFFRTLVSTFVSYASTPKAIAETSNSTRNAVPQAKYTIEESIMHTLEQNSIDLESLDNYVKEDVNKLSQKLGVMHERMKAHLADLLRPALDATASSDGVHAFNDGSNQFVDGDFAADIDEDFFGFRELGLDREFSMDTLSVPFHLLKSRMANAYQSQNTHVITGEDIVPQPQNFEPVSNDSISGEIGIVQAFFINRLANNKNESLIEDDDLPPKQRFPKPRLPPTGKISSPRKRPIREQQQMAKKKRKLEEGREEVLINGVRSNGGLNLLKGPTVSKIRLDPSTTQNGPNGDPEKDDDTGMVSPPESI